MNVARLHMPLTRLLLAATLVVANCCLWVPLAHAMHDGGKADGAFSAPVMAHGMDHAICKAPPQAVAVGDLPSFEAPMTAVPVAGPPFATPQAAPAALSGRAPPDETAPRRILFQTFQI